MSPWITEELKEKAMAKMADMRFKVTLGKHLSEIDDFMSSSLAHRLQDLHDAFADPDIQLIICIRGGFNSNQLLKHLDYDLIRKNPKILCGFSDITALSNAIFAKTGLVGYSGPNFYQFGRTDGIGYMTDYFEKCLMRDEPFMIEPSKEWIDFEKGTHKPQIHANPGPIVLQEGSAEGTLLGAKSVHVQSAPGNRIFPGHPWLGSVSGR